MTRRRKAAPARLTLGPVLFNWPAEQWRDFYFRIADEADLDSVCLGEVVCSKRAPFFAEHLPAVIERLEAADKEVVLSSPILVTTERERQAVAELVAASTHLIEASDIGALALLAGRPHAVGPTINAYNEATLAWIAGRGATRVSLPGELAAPAVRALAAEATRLGVELELTVFGRLPLAISARCYHARAHGLHKDGCQFVCGQDLDGMTVTTLDGEPFLAVNGTQTMSHTYAALVAELPGLLAEGVRRFRLSPQTCDMVEVAALFRRLLAGTVAPGTVTERLRAMAGTAGLSNGFYHARPGVADLTLAE